MLDPLFGTRPFFVCQKVGSSGSFGALWRVTHYYEYRLFEN